QELRNDIRGQYYHINVKPATRRRPYIFVFQPDELDNEDIISRVETTPTYRRTKDELKQIRSRQDEPAPKPVAEKKPADEPQPRQDNPEAPFAGFELG
ncbi:MAG: hypothetical protein K2O17_02675, partial [Bacteroidaceae bacterium]|nr:hypothetical protein [Bacteroidaceae bacterium]